MSGERKAGRYQFSLFIGLIIMQSFTCRHHSVAKRIARTSGHSSALYCWRRSPSPRRRVPCRPAVLPYGWHLDRPRVERSGLWKCAQCPHHDFRTNALGITCGNEKRFHGDGSDNRREQKPVYVVFEPVPSLRQPALGTTAHVSVPVPRPRV